MLWSLIQSIRNWFRTTGMDWGADNLHKFQEKNKSMKYSANCFIYWSNLRIAAVNGKSYIYIWLDTICLFNSPHVTGNDCIWLVISPNMSGLGSSLGFQRYHRYDLPIYIDICIYMLYMYIYIFIHVYIYTHMNVTVSYNSLCLVTMENHL